MAYGRKSIPPPATPFEEFMATASEKMIAAKLDAVEFLRELPPAAWIAVGVLILVLAASSLNLTGKKEAAAEPAATTNADAAADVAAPAKPAGRDGWRGEGGRKDREGLRRTGPLDGRLCHLILLMRSWVWV